MSTDLRTRLRGPHAYDLARAAMAEMQRLGVWPTPLNFELWLQITIDPDGPLNAEVERIIQGGETITEAQSEELAAKHLARNRLAEEVRVAGDGLDLQLRQVQRVIETAQTSSAQYGATLAGASEELEHDLEPTEVKKLVETLADATHQIRRRTDALETGLTASNGEVVRLRARLEAAQREAMTDALSNLPNRKAFDIALTHACEEADETGAPLALAMVDIDLFKRFNDTWGHQTGDQVIRYVASILARAAQEPFFAARYGGEEFAVILPGETGAQAAAILDTVREEIGSRSLKRRSTDEDLGVVTVSTGVAQRGRKELPAALIERADAALYASKRNGRNRVTNAEGRFSSASAAA
ncbi:diguanylate cyclase [Caulobacter sp. S45]|uniref:GGDEF domain-containing protein n=1 Tax=Caulobacter sp. S45 TaxID=1641861 RepID=UPI00131CAB9C|nr:GGDEF domain-containing protein [Caulobacter sp. S45]